MFRQDWQKAGKIVLNLEATAARDALSDLMRKRGTAPFVLGITLGEEQEDDKSF